MSDRTIEEVLGRKGHNRRTATAEKLRRSKQNPDFSKQSRNLSVVDKLMSSGPVFTAMIFSATVLFGGLLAFVYVQFETRSSHATVPMVAGSTVGSAVGNKVENSNKEQDTRVRVATSGEFVELPRSLVPKEKVELPGANGGSVISKSPANIVTPYTLALAPTKQVEPEPISPPKTLTRPVPPKPLPVPVVAAQPVTKVVEKIVADDAAEQIKNLTQSVVDELSKLKQLETVSQNSPVDAVQPFSTDNLRQAISNLVAQAGKSGQSGGAVEKMINDALQGRNAVPSALANAQGGLDTKTLLQSIVPKGNTSKIGGTAGNYLAALESEGNATNMVNQPDTSTRPRFVVVQQGDTLSKIAFRIYGDPLAYPKIFARNRGKLASAHLLKVGQRLTLP